MEARFKGALLWPGTSVWVRVECVTARIHVLEVGYPLWQFRQYKTFKRSGKKRWGHWGYHPEKRWIQISLTILQQGVDISRGCSGLLLPSSVFIYCFLCLNALSFPHCFVPGTHHAAICRAFTKTENCQCRLNWCHQLFLDFEPLKLWHKLRYFSLYIHLALVILLQ